MTIVATRIGLSEMDFLICCPVSIDMNEIGYFRIFQIVMDRTSDECLIFQSSLHIGYIVRNTFDSCNFTFEDDQGIIVDRFCLAVSIVVDKLFQ